MTTDANQASKKLELTNALLISALTGFLTLAGVMSTGVIGWVTASQSSKITKTQTCITRLDAQEKDLREKADKFLSALGEFTAQTGHLKVSLDVYRDRLDALMRTGYAFSAYAPSELSTLSQNMVIELKNSMTANGDEEVKKQLDTFDATNQKWSQKFQQYLSEIAALRKDC